jgi:hypothetical protein
MLLLLALLTYNEKADKLAGEATVFGDPVHEPDDVIKEMEARLNEQENAVQQESWSVQRLIERGWNRGDGIEGSMWRRDGREAW